MSKHVGYIVKVQELRNHSNADRLQIATFFGNDTIVDLTVQRGDIGIYFPSDLQLSIEYCEANNLIRKKDENGNNIGGYLDPNKRNIRPLKLRGEKSDGLYMPLSSLNFTGVDITSLNIGDCFDTINGINICCKYIPYTPKQQNNVLNNKKVKKGHAPIAPLFEEHVDTEQLVYNLDAFKKGDQIEITLKIHGTSQRTGYLPKLQGFKQNFFDRILRRPGKPIYDWGYVSGTRRVVLGGWEDVGFYGSNKFREQHAAKFEGKLWKGETVYYEVCGFTDSGTPIMPSVKNNKIKDKEFSKQYGEETVFSYDCPRGESDCYVYRMTMTNEDGDVVEYTPDFMRHRCEQMGVKCVPVMWRGYLDEPDGWTFTAGEFVKMLAEEFYDGPDPIGKTHVREGVVIRIINRPKFTAYKHKNFSFKVLEGIIKDEEIIPDMEEVQEL